MSVLPVNKVKPTRVNPKIIIFYGAPKVGKTEMLTQLEGCLILDFEKGADMYEANRISISSLSGQVTRKVKRIQPKDGAAFEIYYKGYNSKQHSIYKKDEATGQDVLVSTSFDQVCNDIIANAGEQKRANPDQPPKFPFRYIAIDTVDEMESMCIPVCSDEYHNSTIGKSFEEDSVLDLPKGLGYYYLREKLIEKINQITPLCETLILISHLREKVLDSKGGIDVVAKDISLTGKLSSIVCSKADAIGYMYQEAGKGLMVNFETFENSTMGSRFKRLAGQKFPFDWARIFI